MATWQEILSDRTKYADTTEWTLPDGTKTTVGDMRNQLMPKADFTQATQRAANERRELEQTYQQQIGGFQAQLAQMNQALLARGQAPVSDTDELAQYRNDPTFAPLVKRLEKANDLVEKMSERMERNDQRIAQHEQTWWLNQHANTLRAIQGRDEEYKDPNKARELIEFAKSNGLSNLDLAHQMMTRDRDLTKAREDASREGYERAKTEAAAPHIPGGTTVPSKAPSLGVWEPPKDVSDVHSVMNAAEAAASSEAPGELEKIGAAFAASYNG